MATQTPHTADPRLALRRRMERAVERLLAAMDAMDGDPDLEPSLGALEGTADDDYRWRNRQDDDREDQCEGGGDWDEREPDEYN